jgi:hypothetical protein
MWDKHKKDMWERSKLIAEWQHNGLSYKAVEVPRHSIDENHPKDEDMPALWVIGIDDSGIRTYDMLFDPCFDRLDFESKIELQKLRRHCPNSLLDVVFDIFLYEIYDK